MGSTIQLVGRLTPLQQSIVDQLAGGATMKAEVIAMRLGKSCKGSFRSLLADLVRFGVLAKGAGGYGYRLHYSQAMEQPK